MTTARATRMRTVGLALVVLLVVAAALWVLMAACSPSPKSLASKVKDEPGVVRVDVAEGSGDDWLPFAKLPKYVRVVMEADASVDDVKSVFDEYDDDIDNGDVVQVQVRLKGPKKATLLSGTGTKVDRSMVEDLVEAQVDDDIVGYHRVAAPVRRDVEIEVVPLEWAEVVAVADRYREDEDIDAVTVSSDGFLLIRDTVNEELSRTFARERFVFLVDERFRLTGATVTGRGPLEVYVAPSDQQAVRALADRSAGGDLGIVVVRVLDGPRLP